MAFKEIHTLNGRHALFIEYHDGGGDAPKPVTLKPNKLIDGSWVFPATRYTGEPYMIVKETDTITISFERI